MKCIKSFRIKQDFYGWELTPGFSDMMEYDLEAIKTKNKTAEAFQIWCLIQKVFCGVAISMDNYSS